MNEVDLAENYLEALEYALPHQPNYIQNTIYDILEYNVENNSLYAEPPAGTIIYPSVDIVGNYLGILVLDDNNPVIPGYLKSYRFVLSLIDLIKPINELIAGMSVITVTPHDILMHALRSYPSLHPDEITMSTTTWFNEQDMNIFISAYMVISTTIANRLKSLGIYTKLHHFDVLKNTIIVSADAVERFKL